jgi:3-methyl-2-oxobutanoate hydroxymethyltransferase
LGKGETAMNRDKVTVESIRRKVESGEKVVTVTAYDYFTAKVADRAGVDIILVGDSLGMVMLGYENTLPVTMGDMLHHTKAVVRAKPRAMVVADMPFMSYQVAAEQAVVNAGRFVKEAGADAVKLEGGLRVIDAVRSVLGAAIPLMGHVGLTPQSILRFGGYRVQGKGEEARAAVLKDAQALDDAGCFSIVLEGIPSALGKEITSAVRAATIGIGAGPDCDGQVLVCHDLLGVNDEIVPKFVRRYASLSEDMERAFAKFAEDVRAGKFPSKKESYS